MPSSSSQIDGSGFDIFEVIVTSNFDLNHLIAGNGGSSLIDGGGNNILQGGTGQDVFVYKSGNDTITNYNSGEFLNFATTYTGWDIAEKNLIINAAEGSSLYGGRGNSNDDLYGNLGIDEYIYSYGNGNDNIFQADSEDTINLLNISLEQIAGAQIFDNGVNLKFNDGGSLNISGQAGNFKLGGQTFHADYQKKNLELIYSVLTFSGV